MNNIAMEAVGGVDVGQGRVGAIDPSDNAWLKDMADKLDEYYLVGK